MLRYVKGWTFLGFCMFLKWKEQGFIFFPFFFGGGELEFITIHFDFLLTKNWWQQKCLLQKVCLYDEQNNITSFCSTTVVCTMAELFLAFFTFPTHTNTASNSRHCPYQIPEFGKKIQFNPNSLLEISFTPKKSNSLLCPLRASSSIPRKIKMHVEEFRRIKDPDKLPSPQSSKCTRNSVCPREPHTP